MGRSKLSPDERLRRKREAARLRQRRCRAKKKKEQVVKLPNIPNSKLKISKQVETPSNTKHASRPPMRKRVIPRCNQELKMTQSASDQLAIEKLQRPSEQTTPSCKVRTSSFVTLNPVYNFPQMPPLSTSHILHPSSDNGFSERIDASRDTHVYKPSTSISENELRAVNAMLSLRHSPVPEVSNHCRSKYTPSPRTIATETNTDPTKSRGPLIPDFKVTD